MSLLPKRSPSELLRRGYSDEELSLLYELARLFLENGDIRRAETVLKGLVGIAPDFVPAFLGIAYIKTQNHDYEAAIKFVERAHKVNPEAPEVLLYLITCLITLGDYNTAGSYLGEVAEHIETGLITNPNQVRFFKAQLARYQNRNR